MLRIGEMQLACGKSMRLRILRAKYLTVFFVFQHLLHSFLRFFNTAKKLCLSGDRSMKPSFAIASTRSVRITDFCKFLSLWIAKTIFCCFSASKSLFFTLEFFYQNYKLFFFLKRLCFWLCRALLGLGKMATSLRDLLVGKQFLKQ